jgi:chemotaxis protein CheD
MNHFQYPKAGSSKESTARYGNVSTLTLIRLMTSEGSKTKHLEAQIFGGSHKPDVSTKNIGRENVKMVRRVLARERIKVVSEDVGGELGRKVIFDTTDNTVAVIRVEKIRKDDWYPYQSSR